MKAEDLMIGDWVEFICFDGSRTVVQVTGIHHEIVGRSILGNHWDVIDNVRPITITPKILENIGFVANTHVYPYPYYEYEERDNKLKVGFAFPQGNKTSYKEPWVYIGTERVFIEHLPCVFVHELQHTLRLCGINKEIIL